VTVYRVTFSYHIPFHSVAPMLLPIRVTPQWQHYFETLYYVRNCGNLVITLHTVYIMLDGWLGFNGILSTQVAAISCLKKFVSKANGVYKRDYAFRMNVMEEIFEITSCIEILANDIEVDTADD